MTDEKLLKRIKESTENRIEALILASEVTIHEPTKKDLAIRINKLNLYYQRRYGCSYVLDYQGEPLGIGALR